VVAVDDLTSETYSRPVRTELLVPVVKVGRGRILSRGRPDPPVRRNAAGLLGAANSEGPGRRVPVTVKPGGDTVLRALLDGDRIVILREQRTDARRSYPETDAQTEASGD
jgi:hypothetical protein